MLSRPGLGSPRGHNASAAYTVVSLRDIPGDHGHKGIKAALSQYRYIYGLPANAFPAYLNNEIDLVVPLALSELPLTTALRGRAATARAGPGGCGGLLSGGSEWPAKSGRGKWTFWAKTTGPRPPGAPAFECAALALAFTPFFRRPAPALAAPFRRG